jgi:trimeric autotransporter adhesin
MITYQTALPVPMGAEFSTSSVGESYSTTMTAVSSSSSSSETNSVQYSYTSNSSTTHHSAITLLTQSSGITITNTDGTTTRSRSAQYRTFNESTENLSSSGSTSSSSFTASDVNEFGTTTDSLSTSSSVGSTATTNSATTAITTSLTSSTSRSFTATQTASTSYSLWSTSLVGGTTSTAYTRTSSMSTYVSSVGTTSTTFEGWLFTALTTITVPINISAVHLSYYPSVYEVEAYSSKNEWGFVPTATTSTPFGILNVLGASSARTTIAKRTELAGNYIPTDQTSTSQVYTHSLAFSSTSVSTITFQSLHTTVTATTTWTSLTSYSSFPFPTSSTTTATELLRTTTSSTITANAIAGITSTRSNTHLGFGPGVITTMMTSQSSETLRTTETGVVFGTFHSSLVSITAVTSTGTRSNLRLTSSGGSTQVGGFYVTSYTSSFSSSLGSTTTTRQGTTARSFTRTYTTISRSHFLVTNTASVIGQVRPVALQGFRNPTAPAYSDTYGSAIAVGISNSTSIPFPWITFEQRSGVSCLVTFASTTRTGLAGQSWTFSFSGQSISMTLSSNSTTSTVSATFSVSGSYSDSTSLQTSTVDIGSTTINRAAGAYADVSTVAESAWLSKGGYLSTVRSRTGGADTTSSTFFNGQSTFLDAGNSNELHIFDPATMYMVRIPASSSSSGGEMVTTVRHIY